MKGIQIFSIEINENITKLRKITSKNEINERLKGT